MKSSYIHKNIRQKILTYVAFFLIAFLFLFTAEIAPLSVNAGSQVPTKVTFTSNTTWVVPTGVTSVTIKAWGAGGGGGRASGFIGGGGGYFEGTIDVTPAETLTIRVGGGGLNNGDGGTNGGGFEGAINPGSGGGAGYTGVFRSTVDQNGALIMAGSGGGGGGSLTDQDGGGGGGAEGTSGTGASPGGGGTQSAGGLGKSSGVDGSALTGGTGGSNPGENSGGGGGAGYFGGGGGGESGGPGGGGSGFATSTATATSTTVGTQGISGGAGANQGDVDYPGSVGDGAGGGSNGEDGFIAILYLGSSLTLTGDVLFKGDLAVGGALSKGSGTFVIDHPLDPDNKLLFHSFVESPDVKNIYDGVAKLNKHGEVTIELPAYFEALNRDFRYQFSSLKVPSRDLYIKKEIQGNSFTISGGTPNAFVSWQVTGIRHDPFILAHPIIVEVEKGPDTLVDKGEYLFPELYE